MAVRNQPLNGVCYTAWNSLTNTLQTGDAANHTLRLIRDGVETVPAASPSEMDSVNAPGIYKINLSASEMNCAVIVLCGKSSTANVSLIPVEITTSAS